MILPANLPIDDARVSFELTRYLSDNWVPVIEKDIDGPSSLPLRLDGELSNLRKFSARRRVARPIYPGPGPPTQARHRGLEDRRRHPLPAARFGPITSSTISTPSSVGGTNTTGGLCSRLYAICERKGGQPRFWPTIAQPSWLELKRLA